MVRILISASLAESLVNFRGELIKDLCDRGHRVFACAPDWSANVEAKIVGLGATALRAPLSRTGTNPLDDARYCFVLWRIMRQNNIDVYLGYTVKPVVYGVLAAYAARARARYALITGLGFAFAEQGRETTLAGRVVRGLYWLSLRYASKVFFQNPDDLKLFIAEGLLSVSSSTNVLNGSGVNVTHFSPAPLPRTPVFLFIGRLLGDKGVREYIKAAREVKSSVPSARFLVVGWIDENPNSINQTELQAWQEEGIIEYLGRLDDVRPAIAQASVFVLPSYREGTPRTVLEAMAMGRAIITTDAPGCRQTVIDGDNGLLVPVRSVSALSAAMRQLIDNPEIVEQMGRRSRELVSKKFDVNAVNSKFVTEMGL